MMGNRRFNLKGLYRTPFQEISRSRTSHFRAKSRITWFFAESSDPGIRSRQQEPAQLQVSRWRVESERDLREDHVRENVGFANQLGFAVDNCRFDFPSLVSGAINKFNVRELSSGSRAWTTQFPILQPPRGIAGLLRGTADVASSTEPPCQTLGGQRLCRLAASAPWPGRRNR